MCAHEMLQCAAVVVSKAGECIGAVCGQGKAPAKLLLLELTITAHLATCRVTVYCPTTQKVEVTEATDPYSVSLAADGDRTQVALASFVEAVHSPCPCQACATFVERCRFRCE